MSYSCIMSTIFKKAKDDEIKYKDFFDKVEKAGKVICCWGYDSMHDETILEVFLINYSKSYTTEHFIIRDYNLYLLEALEEIGCEWDKMRNLSTIDRLEDDIGSKIVLYEDKNDDDKRDILQRIIDNLPDFKYYF